MTKTTLFSALAVVLILGGLAWYSQGAKNPTPATGADNSVVTGEESLTVSEKSYDFGVISMKAGVVSRDFVVTNNSAKAINLNQVYTSCMCTTATLITKQGEVGPFGMPGHGLSAPAVKVALAPGEELTVRAAFDPAAHGPAGVGKIDRVITLSGPDFSPLELGISATVKP
ncbi:MAG: DUF1573 domain-containing protein [bacterium]|nr:DUF1573 domain-containing protein [bacterium]